MSKGFQRRPGVGPTSANGTSVASRRSSVFTRHPPVGRNSYIWDADASGPSVGTGFSQLVEEAPARKAEESYRRRGSGSAKAPSTLLADIESPSVRLGVA